MPSYFLSPDDVRARQIAQSVRCAVDVHTFCPDSDQPPSTRAALVCSAARPEPAPGALNSWHHLISPCTAAGTNRLRRASEPSSTTGGTERLPPASAGPAL